jgi:hypothetical protein
LQVCSEYFSFPCRISFHWLLHTHHHLPSGAGTIGQIVADVPRGLYHPTPKNLKLTVRCHLTPRSIKLEALLRLLLCAKYWSNLYLKCISPLTQDDISVFSIVINLHTTQTTYRLTFHPGRLYLFPSFWRNSLHLTTFIVELQVMTDNRVLLYWYCGKNCIRYIN